MYDTNQYTSQSERKSLWWLFWVALVSVLGLVLLAGTSLARDPQPQDSGNIPTCNSEALTLNIAQTQRDFGFQKAIKQFRDNERAGLCRVRHLVFDYVRVIADYDTPSGSGVMVVEIRTWNSGNHYFAIMNRKKVVIRDATP